MELLSKSKLGRLALLRQKKYRDAEHLFIAEGEKSIFELTSAFTPESLIATADWLAAHEGDGRLGMFANIHRATGEQMKRISSFATPPAVLAVFNIPEPKVMVVDPTALYIALDGVQDPGNLGTIIRTADWFGIDRIYASPDTVDVYNAKTVQATMGSLARVKVVYTDLPKLFANNPSMPVYGTLLDGRDIYISSLTANGFVVMGNEGNGLSDRVRRRVQHKLLLPPYPIDSPHAESLNVGIATALVVAEFRRRML